MKANSAYLNLELCYSINEACIGALKLLHLLLQYLHKYPQFEENFTCKARYGTAVVGEQDVMLMGQHGLIHA